HEDIKKLLKRYLAGECTPEERMRVEQWYGQLDIQAEEPTKEQVEEDIIDIRNRLRRSPIRRIAPWYRYAAAVAAVLLLTVGVYYQFKPSGRFKSSSKTATIASQPDIAPGRNRAILELANGKEIILDGSPNGEIAQEGTHAIFKNVDGELVYQLGGGNTSDATIPRF